MAFPVQLTAASSLKPGPIHLDAKVDWLVCREVCIPGKAHLGLDLTVSPDAAPAQPVGALGEALTLIPKPLPDGDKFTVTGGKTDFVLTLTTGKRETDAEFYPFDQDQIANAAPQQIESLSDGIRLRVHRDDTLTKLPATLRGEEGEEDGGLQLEAPSGLAAAGAEGEQHADNRPEGDQDAESVNKTMAAKVLALLAG